MAQTKQTTRNINVKGWKIKPWKTQDPATAQARRSQLHLTDRIYKPDPCRADFKWKVGTTSLAKI